MVRIRIQLKECGLKIKAHFLVSQFNSETAIMIFFFCLLNNACKAPWESTMEGVMCTYIHTKILLTCEISTVYHAARNRLAPNVALSTCMPHIYEYLRPLPRQFSPAYLLLRRSPVLGGNIACFCTGLLGCKRER